MCIRDSIKQAFIRDNFYAISVELELALNNNLMTNEILSALIELQRQRTFVQRQRTYDQRQRTSVA